MSSFMPTVSLILKLAARIRDEGTSIGKHEGSV